MNGKNNCEKLWNIYFQQDLIPWYIAVIIFHKNDVDSEYYRTIKQLLCVLIDGHVFFSKEKFIKLFIHIDHRIGTHESKGYQESALATYLRYIALPGFSPLICEDGSMLVEKKDEGLKNGEYLIRFSRTNPYFLAFCYKLDDEFHKAGIWYDNEEQQYRIGDEELIKFYYINELFNKMCELIKNDFSLSFTTVKPEDFEKIKPITHVYFDDTEEKELKTFIDTRFGCDTEMLFNEFGITSGIEAYYFHNLFNYYLEKNSMEQIDKSEILNYFKLDPNIVNDKLIEQYEHIRTTNDEIHFHKTSKFLIQK